ncbi:hypothetical protein [Roseivirga sp. E12]|uniref:hypothetical protein n=1 Tax=Roseivirga sp. E12 TaxID=2819237 RepID=UPI001ABC17FB|nr:hypothetical protein [Roseivirga sp. E12]MBO3699195.1 hypothetical protein [Roseivirga sp. E12]
MENQETPEEKSVSTEPSEPQNQRLTLSESQLSEIQDGLKDEQNFHLAIGVGALVTILCAILWAVITTTTGYQIGYMALGVGFAVGYTVRYAGKGIDQKFGILGAVYALVGCLLGNLFSQVGFAADYYEVGIFEVFSVLSFGDVIDIMIETFDIMDVLFYGIAVYEGYKFAFRQITQEDLN